MGKASDGVGQEEDATRPHDQVVLGPHNPPPCPPSPVRSKWATCDSQFHKLRSGGRALTWGPPGGGRWWCWRRGRGRARVGWRRGCPVGGRSMRGSGPAGDPGAAGLGEPRADGPACGSASSPGAASSGSGSSAAPEERAPKEHRARSPRRWQWRCSGSEGTRPERGEGPRLHLPPPCPSPAAAVRGAERGPERRASAPPPSMRVLWVGKGGPGEWKQRLGPGVLRSRSVLTDHSRPQPCRLRGDLGLVQARVREFREQ